MGAQGRTAVEGPTSATAAIPLYCINLASSPDRKARMTRRFADLGLLDELRFVPAIERISPLVDQHLARASIEWAPSRRRSEIACLLSHLKALTMFLEETSASSAIVFEDDVLLHRDWHRELARVLDNLEDGATLCSLGYEVVSWEGFSWAGRDPDQQNLMLMNPTPLWGAHAYWLTRQHAEEALAQYEVRIREPRLLSEFIIKWPGAFIAFPPLVIEDGMPSTIRSEHEMGVHRMIHHGWGVENYGADPEDHLLTKRLSNQTICLCMIVRNEAHVIRRLAASVEGLIDTWVICDTGSTDGTPEVVSEVFGHLPGGLYHDEWSDFGTNRSLMLERARGKADYLLILDADQTIRMTRQLRSLQGESYALLVNEPVAHWVPRLVRGDLPWRYVGAAHEYLTCDQPYQSENLFGLVVEHHADGGNRQDKLARELALLEGDLAKDPDNPRTVFYLAQTHREAGHDDQAIGLYGRRIELGGWAEEVFYAMFRRAELVSRQDWDRGVALLLEAWAYRPSRVEPLYTLVQGLRARNEYRLAEMFAAQGLRVAMPEDILFVHREPYDWGLLHEWSEAAYWTGNIHGALDGFEQLLSTRYVPHQVSAQVSRSRDQCRTALGLEEDPDEESADRATLESLWVPDLTRLIAGTELGELQLTVDPAWSISDPTLISDGENLSLLALATRDGGDDEDGAEVFVEVEMSTSFTVSSVQALDGVPVPADEGLGGSGHPRLISLNGTRFVLSETEGAGPSGRGTALARVTNGEFSDAALLTPAHPGSQMNGWIPVVVDGELLFVTSIAPTVSERWDPARGSMRAVRDAAASDGLAEERGATQAVAVPDGFLAVSRRTRSDSNIVEHRFLLFGEDLTLSGASPRFCFREPFGETCGGIALHRDDLLLSFSGKDGGAHVARVPYRAVRAALWPE